MSKNSKIATDTARMLLKINAVSFSFNPLYIFTSGLKGPMYFDNRIILSYPDVRSKVIGFYIDKIKNEIGLDKFDYISATATAAIPQGALVADRLKLPMVYVRPSTKSYGKGQKIEGHLKKRSKVLIVEDHISTAASVINNILSIRDAGGIVKYCITGTTLETKKSQDLFREHKVKLITLTTGRLIMEEGFKNGYISRAEKDIVDLWFQDPDNWEENWDKLKK